MPMAGNEAVPPGRVAVIDTNIVLDLLVFGDAAAGPLRLALAGGMLSWLATAGMRSELARVLAYPHIALRMARDARPADAVLACFDAQARIAEAPSRAALVCRDADDQKFIDLAIAHRALLISKDRHILSMQKKLATLGVRAQAAIGAIDDF
jgi:putative PIN family toxin of toxin-antitoxin system